jgi:hypothetical protein
MATAIEEIVRDAAALNEKAATATRSAPSSRSAT